MTLFEVSEKYNIPPEIIKDYELRYLCGNVKNSAGTHEYSNEDIENLSIIITLLDLGFSADETQKYIKARLCGKNDNSLLCMLCEKRKSILCEIHSMEEKLQRLDYLKYKLADLCGNKR